MRAADAGDDPKGPVGVEEEAEGVGAVVAVALGDRRPISVLGVAAAVAEPVGMSAIEVAVTEHSGHVRTFASHSVAQSRHAAR
jgi:hypothetical protein